MAGSLWGFAEGVVRADVYTHPHRLFWRVLGLEATVFASPWWGGISDRVLRPGASSWRRARWRLPRCDPRAAPRGSGGKRKLPWRGKAGERSTAGAAPVFGAAGRRVCSRVRGG